MMHQSDSLPDRTYIHQVLEGVLLLGGHHRGHGHLKLLILPNTLLEIVLKVAGFVLELIGPDLELADLTLELTGFTLELTDLALEVADLVPQLLLLGRKLLN